MSRVEDLMYEAISEGIHEEVQILNYQKVKLGIFLRLH